MRYLLLSLFVLFYFSSYADMVDTGGKQYYGVITYIDKEKVLLNEGCGATAKTFLWSQNISITFNTTCDHPGWNMSRSPVTADDKCSKRKVFKFLIKGSQQVSYADDFVAENQFLTIKYVNNQGTQRVSFQGIEKYIEWVMYVDMCIADIPQSPAKL